MSWSFSVYHNALLTMMCVSKIFLNPYVISKGIQNYATLHDNFETIPITIKYLLKMLFVPFFAVKIEIGKVEKFLRGEI